MSERQDVFEGIMQQSFDTQEALKFGSNQAAAHDLMVGYSDDGNDKILRQRIDNFSEAHAHGYADDLYRTMERAGFPKQYLSYLSHCALIREDERGTS